MTRGDPDIFRVGWLRFVYTKNRILTLIQNVT
jgi:hypothetical protein